MSKNLRIASTQDLGSATLNYVMQAQEDEWQKKYKLRKEIYIDTYDAIRLIQGLWGLWEYDSRSGNRENSNAYKFSRELFDRPDALVNSFLFNNQMKARIRLLPPHQDELAQKIREDKSRLNALLGFDDLDYELLESLGLRDLMEEAKNSPTMMPPERLQEYLKRIKGVDFYIAHDLLINRLWYERYNKLFKEDKIMAWDDSSYDFGKVTGSKEFNLILKAFDEERNFKSQSNYIDAIAFYLLWERLEAFKKDIATLNTPLPVFFVSNPGTYKALKRIIETKETANMFTYTLERNGERQPFPIVRQAEFFILDAIFNYEDQKNGSTTIHDLMFELRKTFEYELRSHLMVNSLFGGSSANAEEFTQKINTLIKVEFFDKIWAKHEGYEQWRRVVKVHKELPRIAQEEDKEQQRERKKIVEDLRRDTLTFELANEIMHQVFLLNNPHNTELDQIANIDVFSDLSMVRFSFTKSCRDEIQRYATQILKTRGHEEGFKFEARSLLSDIMGGIGNAHSDKEWAVKLTVGLAVLWVFKKYELIARIAQRLNPDAGEYGELNFPNYHIPLIYAAAVCRIEGNGKAQLAKRLAECIEKKFSAASQRPNYKAWLGLAYVWWYIWNTQHRSHDMPEEIGKADFQANQREMTFTFVTHAQYLGAEVVSHLRSRVKEETIVGNYTAERRDDILEQRKQKYYYAINLCLFLTILYGNKQDFLSQNTEKLFLLLNTIEGTSLWHSRYYDTCARYHYRRALLADNSTTFKDMLDLAAGDNKKCTDATRIVESIDYNRQMKEAISRKRSEGYKKWKEKSRLING